MKTKYHELFDEVHASPRLKEEVMNMTKQERTQTVRKLSMSFIIAAVLSVLLAGTALAAATGVPETLREWFDRQWAESGGGEMPKEQSEVVDRLVQPVDVTVINKGVAVTLDSVTPGEGGLWLMYKVKGDVLKGKEVDRWIFCGEELEGGLMEKAAIDHSLGITIRTSTERSVGVTEDGTEVFLMFYDAPKGVDFLEGGELEFRLTDITLYGKTDGLDGKERNSSPIPVPIVGSVEAKWILPFTLAPTENVEALMVKSAKVPCEDHGIGGGPRPDAMEIHDIRVTAMGISFIEPAWEGAEERKYATSDVAIQLKGGVEIASNGSGSLGAMNEGEVFTRSWELPVDLSKAESVRFGDVVIPLEQPQK